MIFGKSGGEDVRVPSVFYLPVPYYKAIYIRQLNLNKIL